MKPAGLGEPLGQRREHPSVRPGQTRPPDLPAEHSDFMPQYQDLRIL